MFDDDVLWLIREEEKEQLLAELRKDAAGTKEAANYGASPMEAAMTSGRQMKNLVLKLNAMQEAQ